jgi:hypothetical protein
MRITPKSGVELNNWRINQDPLTPGGERVRERGEINFLRIHNLWQEIIPH